MLFQLSSWLRQNHDLYKGADFKSNLFQQNQCHKPRSIYPVFTVLRETHMPELVYFRTDLCSIASYMLPGFTHVCYIAQNVLRCPIRYKHPSKLRIFAIYFSCMFRTEGNALSASLRSNMHCRRSHIADWSLSSILIQHLRPYHGSLKF